MSTLSLTNCICRALFSAVACDEAQDWARRSHLLMISGLHPLPWKKRNKQTSHELQNNLDSSCISLCTPSRKRQFKTSQDDTKLPDKTLSASAISKQVSRRCINFPHELTCQILTNQNIRIGRRAWSTRDSEKSQKRLSSLMVKAGWIFASEVSWKSKF